jgi:hypothetical protein
MEGRGSKAVDICLGEADSGKTGKRAEGQR